MPKKRNPQIWLVKAKIGKKTEIIQTPMFVFPWECLLWIKQQKPTCEVLAIEPYRKLSVPK